MDALRTAAATAALALGLVCAPAAGADVLPIDSPESRGALAAGPVLAGGAVVWAEPRAAFGVAVRSWRPGTPPVTVAELPAPRVASGEVPDHRAVQLLASATEVVVRTQFIRFSDSRYYPDDIIGSHAYQGPPGGPLSPADPAAVADQVTDGAAAFTTRDGVRVESRDGSGRGPVTLPGALRALGGSVVALEGESDIRVVDWRAGTELYRVPRRAFAVRAVQGDGLALVSPSDAGPSLALASPDQPQPAGLGVALSGLDALLAEDRVAFADAGSVGVVARDGRLVGLTRIGAPARSGPLAFDGRTVAWATRPCVVTRIVTWTPAGPPPPPATTRCEPARPPLGARVRARSDGALLVPAVCPPYAREGCPTVLSVQVRALRAGRPVGRSSAYPARRVSLFAGAQETLVLRSAHLQRLVRRSRRIEAVILAAVEGLPPVRRRFTVTVPR